MSQEIAHPHESRSPRAPRMDCYHILPLQAGLMRYRAALLNLSISGGYIESDSKSTVGSEILLLMRTQMQNSADSYVRIHGKVIRATSLKKDYAGYGVQWLRAECDESPSILKHFIGEILPGALGQIRVDRSREFSTRDQFTFSFSDRKKSALHARENLSSFENFVNENTSMAKAKTNQDPAPSGDQTLLVTDRRTAPTEMGNRIEKGAREMGSEPNLANDLDEEGSLALESEVAAITTGATHPEIAKFRMPMGSFSSENETDLPRDKTAFAMTTGEETDPSQESKVFAMTTGEETDPSQKSKVFAMRSGEETGPSQESKVFAMRSGEETGPSQESKVFAMRRGEGTAPSQASKVFAMGTGEYTNKTSAPPSGIKSESDASQSAKQNPKVGLSNSEFLRGGSPQMMAEAKPAASEVDKSERRNEMRNPVYGVEISIIVRGKETTGRIRNLSLKGAYISSQEGIPDLASPLTLKIYDSTMKRAVRINGTVVRHGSNNRGTTKEFALTFELPSHPGHAREVTEYLKTLIPS